MPVLNPSEMQTFTKLVECFFEKNTEVDAKDKGKKDLGDETVFTAEDLLRKLNKSNECEMDVDQTCESVLNKPKSYGLWSEVEGK